MLRKIRIALAVLFFIGITLLLVGIGQQWWGWMAKLQFLPSCLAGNFIVIGGILLLTLLFGRIYCSVICPLGIFQDVVIWIRRQVGLIANKINVKRFQKAAQARKEGKETGPVSTIKPEVKHFKFNKERRIVRYSVLALTLIAIFTGIQLFVALIEPYSAYGRMVRSIAGLAEGQSMVPVLLIVAAVTLVIMAVSAWVWGRAWCSNICPVGTVLGLVSRFSLFKIRIDESKCVECGRCGRGCKTACLDTETRTIDYSRCIDCFDCIGRCKENAISFTIAKPSDGGSTPVTPPGSLRSQASRQQTTSAESTDKQQTTCATADEDPKDAPSKSLPLPQSSAAGRLPGDVMGAEPPSKDAHGASRRAFLAQATALTSVVVLGQEKRKDGGLAEVADKQVPERSGRLVPPGAESAEDFYSKCTACQLCVANCPNGVLRPSTDIKHLLQPEMGYEKGFCRPECTVCGDVCPAGAIRPVSKEEKLSIHIGFAKVNEELCIGCAKCSTICPTGAILMVTEDGKKLATVVDTQCIGCGKCEFLCPVRPISAITVNGLEEHRHDE